MIDDGNVEVRVLHFAKKSEAIFVGKLYRENHENRVQVFEKRKGLRLVRRARHLDRVRREELGDPITKRGVVVDDEGVALGHRKSLGGSGSRPAGAGRPLTPDGQLFN